MMNILHWLECQRDRSAKQIGISDRHRRSTWTGIWPVISPDGIVFDSVGDLYVGDVVDADGFKYCATVRSPLNHGGFKNPNGWTAQRMVQFELLM